MVANFTFFTIGKYRINYLPMSVKGSISALPWLGAHMTPFSLYHLYVRSDIMEMSIQLFQFQNRPKQISLATKPLNLQPTFCFFLNMCLYNYIYFLCFSSSELNTYSLILGKYMGPIKKDLCTYIWEWIFFIFFMCKFNTGNICVYVCEWMLKKT